MDMSAVLPIVSLVALFGALIVAAASWIVSPAQQPMTPRTRDGITAWDVSGALALIGVAASVFGEPDYVIALSSRHDVK